ncbi:MAG: prepilin-type N-terminal cleavage/methylation domain-containing protein [Planctomycetota bacterium]|jgi:prepilin-type N-terminal cleavage/methylation domain-containing protein
MRKAFTLTEILIVIGIIGIIAAIVIPEFQSHTQKAKEAAAKDNLRILRNTIEFYAAQHNGIPPGYFNDDPSNPPSPILFRQQLVSNGYLLKIPENPFNNSSVVAVLADAADFPAEAVFFDLYGWMYKPATKTIRLYWPGTDSTGVVYFDY